MLDQPRLHEGERAASAGRQPPATERPPLLVCFAGDSWDGNPHSRHHLMRRFAGDFEVLFIEGMAMRSVARPDRHELRRTWRKLRAGIRLAEVAPHLHVLRAAPIPPAGRLGHSAQLTAVRGHIAYARRRLRLDGPLVSWFSVPTAAPLRGRLGERGSIFYYQDRYHEFSYVDGPRLRNFVSELATGCDACIATSGALMEDLRRLGADPVLVPHGVDIDRFAVEHAEPRDLVELERPLVGHIGLIDDHLCLDLILAVADRLERGTVVLIGSENTDISSLRHPRIAHLGFRPYESIPAYLYAFACCLVPFKFNQLTIAVNPIKLREYLAAGRPVVATPLPAVREYADVVALASEPSEFADAVVRMLAPAHQARGEQERRRRRVASESWDHVADRIRPTLLALAGVARSA